MDNLQLQQDKIRTELDDLRTEVDRLKSRSAEQDGDDTSRFDKYLETLEAKRDEIIANLDSMKESSGEAWTDIRKGLKEAKQRLAIARLAARSRFH